MAEKVTKETAPKPAGMYVNDDGSYTLIGTDGKELKSPYEPLENVISGAISWRGLGKFFKYSGKIVKELGKDLALDTKTKLGVFGTDIKNLSTYIDKQDQKIRLKQSKNKMVWSDKHNKYMSEYELKMQTLIEAGQNDSQ